MELYILFYFIYFISVRIFLEYQDFSYYALHTHLNIKSERPIETLCLKMMRMLTSRILNKIAESMDFRLYLLWSGIKLRL